MAIESLLDEVESVTEEPIEVRRGVFYRLIRDPQAVITGTILVLFVLGGLLANVIAQHGPNFVDFWNVNSPVGTPGFPLGTDGQGRDVLARLLHSINTALVSALIAASIALVVGITFGLIGGYFRRLHGVTDWLFSIIMTFPGILLLIVLMPITRGDFRWTMFVFGFLMSPAVFRIVRNQTIGVARELYVDAAKVSGVTHTRILFKHILSVVRGPVIIATAFLTGTAINTQAGLAFLGVGSLEIPSFGAMISDGFQNLRAMPTQYLWPTLTLGVFSASIVLFGNALRDTIEGARPKPQKITATAMVDGFSAEAGPADEKALLQVRDLGIAYKSPAGVLNEVVKGVSLNLAPGETLGLIGESGSGKTQTAFGVLGVLPNEAKVTRGSVRIDGNELLGADEPTMRALRGSTIAYVPQEPMSNLDPVYKIGHHLVERIRAAGAGPKELTNPKVSKAAAKHLALELLERVGIPDPGRTFNSYPHEISGGMAQRVLIAGAVAGKPKILIADEPTTALDVTVQAEILDLIRDLQAEMNMAVIMVTHNFGVVADICDRIAVMQRGEIVEEGIIREVFANPQHEYTKMLLDSILDEDTIRQDPPRSVIKVKAAQVIAALKEASA
ncbi:MAG: dipeptide/oligopeptide/nickel ABC transporter permease/ATP-binding protein [Promicromonosporaceae bacterium]|nr:dipeptide/oligopeptide/nickel ABC transporter permease/ATP-binding protein [Promicromonosporaceae bacterium]